MKNYQVLDNTATTKVNVKNMKNNIPTFYVKTCFIFVQTINRAMHIPKYEDGQLYGKRPSQRR